MNSSTPNSKLQTSNSKLFFRDLFLSVCMCVAAAYVYMHPIERIDPASRIHLVEHVPASFGDWKSRTRDMSEYDGLYDSINEVLVRDYINGFGYEHVTALIEYSSDLRRKYAFHFPEICHKSGGNEVVQLTPLEIQVSPTKTIKAKCLYIKGSKDGIEKQNKMVVYWLVMDGKQFYTTFSIKLDQMLSGLLKKNKQGFLIRVDFSDQMNYNDAHMLRAQKAVALFVKDFYLSLNDDQRNMFFGKETST